MGEQIKEGETPVFFSQLSEKIGPENEKKELNLSYSDSENNFKNKVIRALLLGSMRKFLANIEIVVKLSEMRGLSVTTNY